MNKGGIAFRCNIQITKRPELRFRGVVGDGTREVRFEWGEGKRLLEGVLSPKFSGPQLNAVG